MSTPGWKLLPAPLIEIITTAFAQEISLGNDDPNFPGWLAQVNPSLHKSLLNALASQNQPEKPENNRFNSLIKMGVCAGDRSHSFFSDLFLYSRS
jgi:hypothetical protein